MIVRTLAPRWLLGLLVLGTILPGFVCSARAQVSPGALSRFHEDLDTTLGCLKCHGPGKEALRQRCLECHQEIAWLEANQRGLHGQGGYQDCSNCHLEHAGRDAPIVRFREGSPEQFDHTRSGWPLVGKHVVTECAKCHKPALRASEAARLSKRKNVEGSFIGLERECAACHEDPHRETLGQNCTQCHLVTTWKTTPGFDHGKTEFPLTGRHSDVGCEKCHRQGASGTGSRPTASREFKAVRHEQCSDCHRDVHQGKAGPSCSSCHVTENFFVVKDRSFDHARTGYPLVGKHAKVECEACHRKRPSSQGEVLPPLPHERCDDCHTDAHGGQLAKRQGGGECAACHRPEGWTPSTFTAEDHAALPFDLEGRHAAARCASCHGPQSKGPASAMSAKALGRARVALALGQPRCVACHDDPHRGRFEPGGARVQEQGCRVCHGVDGFRPSTLVAADHAGLGFALAGAHATVACGGCHKQIGPPDSPPRPKSAAPLAFEAENSCLACHRTKSPHGDQFATRRDQGACESCHDDNAFRPAPRFDHDRDTRFPLLRSHGNVACEKCHEGEPGPSGELVVLYSPLTFDCKECHRRTAPWLPERGAGMAPTEQPRRRKRRRP